MSINKRFLRLYKETEDYPTEIAAKAPYALYALIYGSDAVNRENPEVVASGYVGWLAFRNEVINWNPATVWYDVACDRLFYKGDRGWVEVPYEYDSTSIKKKSCEGYSSV